MTEFLISRSPVRLGSNFMYGQFDRDDGDQTMSVEVAEALLRAHNAVRSAAPAPHHHWEAGSGGHDASRFMFGRLSDPPSVALFDDKFLNIRGTEPQ